MEQSLRAVRSVGVQGDGLRQRDRCCAPPRRVPLCWKGDFCLASGDCAGCGGETTRTTARAAASRAPATRASPAARRAIRAARATGARGRVAAPIAQPQGGAEPSNRGGIPRTGVRDPRRVP
jgi:hypothetical protein